MAQQFRLVNYHNLPRYHERCAVRVVTMRRGGWQVWQVVNISRNQMGD